jgi:DNA polymerase/3'-5' exonuclease PolX
VDYGSYFAALNYFTGGYLHNEWLRGIAKKSGYRLNQAGLYKYEGKELKLIPLTNEKQIYEILRAEWVPPEQRS